MNAAKRILVVVEPDIYPRDVVARGAWLAGLEGGSLHLLLCDADVSALDHGVFLSNEARDIARHMRALQEAQIDEFAAIARDAGASVSTEIVDERPIADAVLHRAADLQPAYLLKGTRYHSAAERAFFVDTDWQILRSAACPVWLVKPRTMREHPYIVAAVDPTHSHDKPAALDQEIVDHAQRIAGATSGEVHLLHTYHRLKGIGKEVGRTVKPIEIPIDEISKRIQAEHRQKLEALAGGNDIDSEHTHQLPGDARELIPFFARTHGADLVVMGALARWGVRRAVFGSTAEKVLDHLPCDTLVVRLPD